MNRRFRPVQPAEGRLAVEQGQYANLHNLHVNGHRRLESRRRTSPWIAVLVVATAMYSASIGITIAVAFTLESRVAAIEAFLGNGQE